MTKKKKPNNKKTSQKWTKFKVEGKTITRSKNCPKCGPGMFLGIHKDRVHCGKCHYVEYIKK